MIRNYLAVLEYDGTKYNGWQKQGNTDNTIQGRLETLLSRLLEQHVQVAGAGRTDKGVHATGQCASFQCECTYTPAELMRRINEYLPRDIAVKSLKLMPPRFHARLNAKGKKYHYVLLTGGSKSAFLSNYAWSLDCSLDTSLMVDASKVLLGEHDFLPFCDLKKSKKSTIRRLDSIDIRVDGEKVSFDFVGNGFLYHMVRKITSALVSVGTGQLSADQLKLSLTSGDGSLLPPPAPARGLFLSEVYYK